MFEGLHPSELAVVDIGAGTGISSRLLAQRVRVVYAVEPNAAMRAKAEPAVNVHWLAGTGERTGLRTDGVDMAVAMQAFHWFDSDKAWREMCRIAKSRVAMVQYERDEQEGSFAQAYAEAIRPLMTDDTEAKRMRALENFTRLAQRQLVRSAVPSSDLLTLEGVLGRAASTSYLPQKGPQNEQLQQHLRAAFERHQKKGLVELAMTNHVLVCDIKR